MGCCDSDSEENKTENGERKCTDVFWLCLYILFWFLMIVIAAFSFVYGNPIRIIKGYDSFGNTCGTKNKAMGNLTYTGIDTTDKPFLLFYDISELKESLKICVKECPKQTINTVQGIKKSHETGNDLCQYNFNYGLLDNVDSKSLFTKTLGPCPLLPIYKRLKPLISVEV